MWRVFMVTMIWGLFISHRRVLIFHTWLIVKIELFRLQNKGAIKSLGLDVIQFDNERSFHLDKKDFLIYFRNLYYVPLSLLVC